MSFKCKHTVCSLSAGGLLAVGLFLLLRGTSQGASAGPQALFVSTAGTNSGACTSSINPCHTVQYAVDQAADGDEIRVATGTYTDIRQRAGITQVIYISKTVTIQGGYTTTNWTVPNPATKPTTLDAQGQGRVIYITGDISPTVEGLCITGGDAAGFGGGLSDIDAGGGVYVVTATATIRDNQVFSNTAGYGGGLYLSSSDATLSSNTVTANFALYRGGGLALDHSNATLSGNSVTANTGEAYGCGGLYLYYSDDTLSGNTVTNNNGGLCLWESDATLTSNVIAANIGNTYGGGLRLAGGDVTLTGNIVTTNTARYRGGGLYLDHSAATLTSNVIAANIANTDGGGLYLLCSGATLTNNVIADNQANAAGSGLYIRDSTAGLRQTAHLLHNTIARNTGGDGSGVHVTQWGQPDSTVILTNTILVSHTVGITVTAGNTAILNRVLWYGNTTANIGGAGTITVTSEYTGHPGFAVDGYHLASGSAAIDEGIDAGVTNDIDGQIRDAAPDLGADEFVSGEPDITVAPLAMSTILNPGDAATRTLAIGNVGDTGLTWSLAEDPVVTWLSEAPRSGVVAPSGSSDVTVTFDPTGLAEGLHTTTLRVSSNDPDTPQVDVSVVLTVGSGDVHEPDDTCSQASALAIDGTVQQHTFHQHADVDWARFAAASDTTYVLQATSTSPDADLELELYDVCGGALKGSDDNAFGNDARLIFTAPSSATYYVKALNHDPATYGPDVTYELSVRAQIPGGVVLIVAGHDDNYHLQDNILYAANFAYRTFRRGGILQAHIRYLSAIDDDSRTDADGNGDSDVCDSSASTHVETAITTWAANLAGSRTPFYLYLIDHGGSDVFLTDGSDDTLTPDELDGWLNALEAATGTPVTVIYEACHSGSFIDGLEEISAPGRVVIASTGRVNSAYPAPGRGAYFSDAFFTALGQSQDLYTSFQWGVAAVGATGLWQTPWLDDNGNAVPNEADDGAVARGWGLANFAFPAERPPVIDWVLPPAHIENGEGLIRAQVRDDTHIARVWAVVYPPSFVEPDPSPDGTMPDLGLPEVELSDSDADGEYVGVCENFTEDGVYRLVFYAEDGEGNLSQPGVLEVRTGWPVYLPLVLR